MQPFSSGEQTKAGDDTMPKNRSLALEVVTHVLTAVVVVSCVPRSWSAGIATAGACRRMASVAHAQYHVDRFFCDQ